MAVSVSGRLIAPSTSPFSGTFSQISCQGHPVEVPAGTSYRIAMRSLMLATFLLVSATRFPFSGTQAADERPTPPPLVVVPYTRDPPCRYFQDCQQET